MLSASSSARNSGTRSPFTPTQWQELEHQALIFKYMVSGVPIPSELIYAVKRSLDSRLFPHQPIGWGCFQMDFGRKADPEPGRCRRTDGKKWRCSKEAYPDSKYCERHMHRGRNRSRKPVEITSTTATTTVITNPLSSSSSSSSSSSPSTTSFNRNPNIVINNNSLTGTISTTSCYPIASSELYTHHYHNPFIHSASSSARTPGSAGFSLQNERSTHHQYHFLDSGSYSQADKDYRYMDERAFFPETSGNARSLHESSSSFQPLTMSSYKGYSESHNYQGYSTDYSRQQQEQHCFVLGTDFRSSAAASARTSTMKLDKEDHDQTQKQLHHFFGEWPPKNTTTDSWLDLASTNSRGHPDS